MRIMRRGWGRIFGFRLHIMLCFSRQFWREDGATRCSEPELKTGSEPKLKIVLRISFWIKKNNLSLHLLTPLQEKYLLHRLKIRAPNTRSSGKFNNALLRLCLVSNWGRTRSGGAARPASDCADKTGPTTTALRIGGVQPPTSPQQCSVSHYLIFATAGQRFWPCRQSWVFRYALFVYLPIYTGKLNTGMHCLYICPYIPVNPILVCTVCIFAHTYR